MGNTLIPTDIHALVALLEAAPPASWLDVRSTLISQRPVGVDAERLFDNAAEEAMNNLNADQERSALREELRQIMLRVSYAVQHVAALRGDGMFDVEYGEGDNGRDLAQLLTEIGQKARLATAVNDKIMRTYEMPGSAS